MHCAISLTNQKQSVVSGREFAICCAHGLCSLAYCFSHCALDFPPTHPIVIPPLPALALPAVAPAACRVFVFRLLTCARWLLAGLPPAACRPLGLPACPPPLWLFARSRAIDPSPSGCLPGVRLLADVCICASAY
jgi:hypothetical protein